MKLGDKMFYTFEEAAEILHPLYSARKLKDAAYRDALPHSGGRGKGKVCYSDEDLRAIIAMNCNPSSEKTANVTKAGGGQPLITAVTAETPELPDVFRQTSRSRARHRNAA